MPRCTFCNAEIPAAGSHCPACGQAQSSTTVSTPPAAGEATAATPARQPEPTNSRLAIHPTQIIAGICVLAAIAWIAFSPEPGSWLLLLGPLVIACAWPISRNARFTAWADCQETRFQSGLARQQGKTGKVARYFFRPLYGGCVWIWNKAAVVPDPHLRAGVRAASILYFAAAMLFIGLTVGYIILALIIGIAILAFAAWAYSIASGEKRPQSHYEEDAPPLALRPDRSRRGTDWLGNPKTILKKDGRKVGEVRPATDFFGNPKEVVYDRNGQKVGERRPATDLLGDPKTVEYDDSGQKMGESRPGTDWLGAPVERHYDESGTKVGESRQGTDLLGNPVVKHEWEDDKG